MKALSPRSSVIDVASAPGMPRAAMRGDVGEHLGQRAVDEHDPAQLSQQVLHAHSVPGRTPRNPPPFARRDADRSGWTRPDPDPVPPRADARGRRWPATCVPRAGPRRLAERARPLRPRRRLALAARGDARRLARPQRPARPHRAPLGLLRLDRRRPRRSAAGVRGTGLQRPAARRRRRARPGRGRPERLVAGPERRGPRPAAGPGRRPRPRARWHGPAPGRPALHGLRLGGAAGTQARLGAAALRPHREQRPAAAASCPSPAPPHFHPD